MKKTFLLIIFFCCLIGSQAFGQATTFDHRDQFYKVKELIRLIQKAKAAGFTDEQIRNLTIQDGPEEINVMEYIEKIRQKEAAQSERMQEFLSKQFLTPQDVFNELVTMEPDELGKLREELIRE